MKSKKHYTAEFKIKVVREHLENQEKISDLSSKYGINPNLVYKWQKELFEGAISIFSRRTDGLDGKSEEKIKRLEEKIRQKDNVISELVEENLEIKKNIIGGI